MKISLDLQVLTIHIISLYPTVGLLRKWSKPWTDNALQNYECEGFRLFEIVQKLRYIESNTGESTRWGNLRHPRVRFLTKFKYLFTGIYLCCSNIYNTFIKYIVLYDEIHLKYCRDTVAYVSIVLFTRLAELENDCNLTQGCRRFPYLVLFPVFDFISH
jgi:hypothetical protein